MSELLHIISALISSLRIRPKGPKTPTAAELLLISLIQQIAEMRIAKGFEYKEAADDALKTAMSVLGPEVLLKALPLNLEPEDRYEWIKKLEDNTMLTLRYACRTAGREPRAFLLPLLVHPHPSPLKHFISYFIPLTERMFDLQQKAEAEGRQSEAKVWNVLVAQVWNGLPAYCYKTPDFQEVRIQVFVVSTPITNCLHLVS